jgi:hypothetical protein
VRSKWHTAQRNVAIGDIVWLCDQNASRGHFKLGRVISVNPDSRNIVRDVNIRVVVSSCIPEVRPVTLSSKFPTSKHRISSIRGTFSPQFFTGMFDGWWSYCQWRSRLGVQEEISDY